MQVVGARDTRAKAALADRNRAGASRDNAPRIHATVPAIFALAERVPTQCTQRSLLTLGRPPAIAYFINIEAAASAT